MVLRKNIQILLIIITIILFIYAYYTNQIVGYIVVILLIILDSIIGYLFSGGVNDLNPEIEINISYNKKFRAAYNIEEHFIMELINKGNNIANNISGKILYVKNKHVIGNHILENLSEIGAIASTITIKYNFNFDYEISNFDGFYIYITYENPDKKRLKYSSSKYFYFRPSTAILKNIELRRQNKIIFVKEEFETQIIPYNKFAKLTMWKAKPFFKF